MKKVLFRVDSSSIIGGGHLARCLELAKLFKKNEYSIYFVCINFDGNLNNWITKENFNLLLIENKSKDYCRDFENSEKLIKNLGKFNFIVVDNYQLDILWESKMRKYSKKIIAIDDLANRKHDCDILIDQNFTENNYLRYDGLVNKNTIMLLSPKYSIIKKEFRNINLKKSINKKVENIFICFGATDPNNHSLKVLEALELLNHKLNSINVFTTEENLNYEDLKKKCSAIQNCFFNSNKLQLPEILSSCDLAVGGGGSMCWERAFLGIPSIVFGIAENQIEIIKALIKNEIVVGEYWHPKPDIKIIKYWLEFAINNPQILEKLSNNSKKMVDGFGLDRINEFIQPVEFNFRKVTLSDAKKLYIWRNNPDIRKISKDKNTFKFDSHMIWLKKVLEDPEILFLIAENENEPIGVIRFNIFENIASLSIYKVPNSRKSFGLLKKSSNWLFKTHPNIKGIKAEILEENEVSYNAFYSAGYRPFKSTMYLDKNWK